MPPRSLRDQLPTAVDQIARRGISAALEAIDRSGIYVQDIVGGYSVLAASTNIAPAVQTAVNRLVMLLNANIARTSTVVVPPGVFAWTESVTINDPRVTLRGYGTALTRINKTGTGAAVIYRPSAANFSVLFNAGIYGFRFVGDNTAGNMGIEYGDTIGLTIEDVTVSEFRGTGAVGIWARNVNYFTERTIWNKVHTDYCTIGHLMSNDNVIEPTFNSQGMAKYLSWSINVDAGQVGWKIEDNCFFYNAQVIMNANVVDNCRAVIEVADTAICLDNFGSLVGEQTLGTGGVAFRVANGAFFHFFGVAAFGTLTNVDNNPPANPPRLWIRDGTQFSNGLKITGNCGSFTYRGVANSEPGWLQVSKTGAPYAGLATIVGDAVESPALVMYGLGNNAASFLALDFGFTLATSRLVGAVNNQGDFEIGRHIEFLNGPGGETNGTITIGASSFIDLPKRIQGGMLILRDGTAGGVGIYRVDEAVGSAIISANAQFVVGAAGASQIGVAASATETRISNGYAASRIVHYTITAAQWA